MRTAAENQRCYEVAKTINEQLFWSIDVPTYWSWGVSKKLFTYYNYMPSLMMRVSGVIHKGWVVISLNEASDAYEVRLLNVSKEEKAKYEDIYCDNLGSFIDGLIEKAPGQSMEEYGKLAKADSDKKMAMAEF